VSEPHRAASLAPGDGFTLDFEIDFDNPIVAQQEWYGAVTYESYKEEISRARTFGFLHEIDKLREMGLARGGSLDNAVVISGDEILNEGGLRYDNEFVRHKVLDSIGDLLLAGGTIIGHFSGLRAGHSLTLRLLQQLFTDEQAWQWCDMTELDLMPAIAKPATAMAATA
jgi:UDP-3-O-[3-hydroxymyristoyl] N-acetylglucosamine deacetylase